MELLTTLIVFMAVLVIGVLLISRHDSRLQLRRLLERIARPALEDETADGGITRDVAQPKWGLLGSLLARARLVRRFEEILWQAGIYTSPGDVLALAVVLAAGGAAVGAVFGGAEAVPVLLTALGLGLLPLLYILWRRRRRLRAFDRQLPEILDMLKASLEAGHTLQRALQVAVEEFSEPAVGELRIVLEQNSLGVPLDRSLEFMLQRMPDENLRFLVTAVKIQTQAGASLARIIDQLASTVRDRQRVEMKVRVLTAQPKLTGIIAGLMPILLVLGLHFVTPENVSMLFHDPAGVQITKAVAALELIACIIVYRLLRVDY
jgi:tight adherence protein B